MPSAGRNRKKKFRESSANFVDRQKSDEFNRKIRRDFHEMGEAETASPFVLPHASTRYRDSKGRFRKLPPNGKKPAGWKRVTVTTYTDATGKTVAKPFSPDFIASRSIQYREDKKGSRWKTADKVDFRQPLFARVVEQTGDRAQPVKVRDLNNGKSQIWSKSKKAESKQYLFPAIVPDRKIELRLEGSTVKEALSKFAWDVAEWGQEVHVTGSVKYEYTDEEGIRHREKFAVNMVEDWRTAPNMGQWIYNDIGEKVEFIKGENTYGDILKTNLGIEIREGFARRQVRFTTLDALSDLFDAGMIPEELFEELESRDQAERVTLYLLISIRQKTKK